MNGDDHEGDVRPYEYLDVQTRRLANPEPLFKLGRLVITRSVRALGERVELPTILRWHHFGIWTEGPDVDFDANEDALKNGDRLLLVYAVKGGGVVWVITEADRSLTTVLLPEEY